MSNSLFRKLFIKHSTPVEKSIGGTPVVDENLQKIAGAVAARAAPIIGRAARAGVKAVKPYVTQAGKAGLGAAAKAGKAALWSGAQAAKPHVAAALESAKAGKAAGGLGAAAKAAKPHLGTAGKVGLGTAGSEFGADMGARASKKIQENVPPPSSTNEPPPSTNGKPFYYSKLLNKKSFDTLFTKQNPALAAQMAKRGLIFDKNRHRWIKKPESREQPSYGARREKEKELSKPKRTLLPSGFSLNDKSAAGWASTIEGAINAPVAKVEVSTLGGKENVSLIVRISLDKKEDWGNDIWQNSRWAMINLSKDGKMEMPYHGLGKGNRMRKTKFKSPEDATQKINSWINKVK